MTWSVHHVGAHYGDTVALSDVSLEITPGDTHAVIGGDGAGKSTLLKVLVGLDVGQTGDVDLPAQDRVGYLPSAGGVFGDLTVVENLEFVAAAHHLRGWRPWADELLERAAIGAFTDRLAGHLSGGQRRKLAGCLALLPRPDLIVLDEVTTGVDPVSRMELWRLVTRAAADGAAIVASTTYLDEAERADTVLLLHLGRVLAAGPPGGIVDGVPGAVVDLDAPDDVHTAWRAGRRWRQWQPDATTRDRPLTLEDAAIVLELQATATEPEGEPEPTTGRPPTSSTGFDQADLPISARAVTRTFGSFVAVDHCDIDVAPGEIVGLLGANGAGKTTLIRMLLGLLTPTSGRIRLFGQPHSRQQRRRIGYVPQNLGLYTDLTATENLQFRAAVFGGAGATAVDGRAPAAGHTLVGDQPLGTQRRVAFQAATQHGPDLLVLDEPTSGVSPLARSRLWDLIHHHADRGVAVLVSTHYMDEAEQADRLLLMSAGGIVATGTARRGGRGPHRHRGGHVPVGRRVRHARPARPVPAPRRSDAAHPRRTARAHPPRAGRTPESMPPSAPAPPPSTRC